ncbi:uncharacterized protein LOC108468715 [Gossypium arboreum]|uniref:uncharacterized protein LOC108468715 n=1 Tax=Gossypium arboreum TaxID=29729 RepID=UPI0008191E0D|nr:uncharacterized protein LOC108468715 [Gossypium arboreum]
MVPYKTLYGHSCRTPSCWTELDDHHALGSELVADIKDKFRVIQDQLKAALDKQKSYTDLKHKDIEYAMGDFVFLKVSSWKKLQLRPELERIHDVFHISMLRRYCSNPMHVVPVEEIEIRADLTFEEEPIQILDQEVKVLRRKSIPLVKVLWRNHSSEVATWEPEEAIRQ